MQLGDDVRNGVANARDFLQALLSDQIFQAPFFFSDAL
jgi:hypothetical protein